jgi:hypothetical protein
MMIGRGEAEMQKGVENRRVGVMICCLTNTVDMKEVEVCREEKRGRMEEGDPRAIAVSIAHGDALR